MLCEDHDITTTQFLLDNGAKKQERAIIVGLNKLVKLNGKKKTKKYAKKTRTLAHELQLANWILSWELPSVFSTCANTFCVTSSNKPQLETYRGRADTLRDMGEEVLARIILELEKRGLQEGKQEKRLRKRIERVYNENIQLSETVPETVSSCS